MDDHIQMIKPDHRREQMLNRVLLDIEVEMRRLRSRLTELGQEKTTLQSKPGKQKRT